MQTVFVILTVVGLFPDRPYIKVNWHEEAQKEKTEYRRRELVRTPRRECYKVYEMSPADNDLVTCTIIQQG